MSDRLKQLLTHQGERHVGKFRLDRGRAVDTMRRFQLTSPHAFVLMFHQALRALGAGHIGYRIDSNDVELWAEGVTIAPEHLRELWDGLFIRPESAPDEAWHRLALGVNAALALGPDHVRVESGAVALVVKGHEDIELVEHDPKKPTRVHVRQRLDWRTVREAALLLVKRPPEAELVSAHCGLDERPWTLNGADATVPAAPWRGEAAGVRYVFEPHLAGGAPVPIVKYGVRLDAHALPLELPVRGWVHADRVRTSVSQDAVVQDAALTAILRGVAEGMLAKAADLVLAPPPAMAADTVASLGRGVALALEDAALRTRRAGLAVKLRMLEWVPALGERLVRPQEALAQAARLGAVAYVTSPAVWQKPVVVGLRRELPESLAGRGQLVVVVGEAEARSVARLDPEAPPVEDVTGSFAAFVARWRRVEAAYAKKRQASLETSELRFREVVDKRGVKGEVGIPAKPEPGSGRILWLRQGVPLAEEPLPAWGNGLVAVVDAEHLSTDKEFLKVLHDNEHRVALAAVRAAVPKLIASAAAQRHPAAPPLARAYMEAELEAHPTRAKALWQGAAEVEPLRHLPVIEGLGKTYTLDELSRRPGPLWVVSEEVGPVIGARAFGADDVVLFGKGEGGALLRAVAPERQLADGSPRLRAAARWIAPPRALDLPPGVAHVGRYAAGETTALVGYVKGAVALAEVSRSGRPLVELLLEELPAGLRFAVEAPWIEPNADHDGIGTAADRERLGILLARFAQDWLAEMVTFVPSPEWRSMALELAGLVGLEGLRSELRSAELLPCASGKSRKLAWLERELETHGGVLWARATDELGPLRFGRDYLVLGSRERDAVKKLVGPRLGSALSELEAARRFEQAKAKAKPPARRVPNLWPAAASLDGGSLVMSLDSGSRSGAIVVTAAGKEVCTWDLAADSPVEGRLEVSEDLVDHTFRGLFADADQRLRAEVKLRARQLVADAAARLTPGEGPDWLEPALRRYVTAGQEESSDLAQVPLFCDAGGERLSLAALRGRGELWAVPHGWRLEVENDVVVADAGRGLVYAAVARPLGMKPSRASLVIFPDERRRLEKAGVKLVQVREQLETEVAGWVRRRRKKLERLELPSSEVAFQERFELDGGSLVLVLLRQGGGGQGRMELFIEGRRVAERPLPLPAAFLARLDAPGLIANQAFDDVADDGRLARLRADTLELVPDFLTRALKRGVLPSFSRGALLHYLVARGLDGLPEGLVQEPLVPTVRGGLLSLAQVVARAAQGTLDLATKAPVLNAGEMTSEVPADTLLVDELAAEAFESRFTTKRWDAQIKRENEFAARLADAPRLPMVPHGGLADLELEDAPPGGPKLQAGVALRRPGGPSLVRFLRGRRRLADERLQLPITVEAHVDGPFMPGARFEGVRHDALFERAQALVERGGRELLLKHLRRWPSAELSERNLLDDLLAIGLDDPTLAAEVRRLELFVTARETLVSWEQLEEDRRVHGTTAWIRPDALRRSGPILRVAAGASRQPPRIVLLFEGPLPKTLRERLPLENYAGRLEAERRAQTILATPVRAPRSPGYLVAELTALPRGFSGVLGLSPEPGGVGLLVDGRLVQVLPQVEVRAGLVGELTHPDLAADELWTSVKDTTEVERLLDEVFPGLVVALVERFAKGEVSGGQREVARRVLLRYLGKVPPLRKGTNDAVLERVAGLEIFQAGAATVVSLARLLELSEEQGAIVVSPKPVLDEGKVVITADDVERTVLERHLGTGRVKLYRPPAKPAPAPAAPKPDKKKRPKPEVPEGPAASPLLLELKLLLRTANKRSDRQLQKSLLDAIHIGKAGRRAPPVEDDGRRVQVNLEHPLVQRAEADREAMALLALAVVAEINRARPEVVDSEELAFHHALVRQVLSAQAKVESK